MGYRSVDFVWISRGDIHGISVRGFRMDIPSGTSMGHPVDIFHIHVYMWILCTSMGYPYVDFVWIFRAGPPRDIYWMSSISISMGGHCGPKMDIPWISRVMWGYSLYRC